MQLVFLHCGYLSIGDIPEESDSFVIELPDRVGAFKVSIALAICAFKTRATGTLGLQASTPKASLTPFSSGWKPS